LLRAAADTIGEQSTVEERPPSELERWGAGGQPASSKGGSGDRPGNSGGRGRRPADELGRLGAAVDQRALEVGAAVDR
jgi:hypothetical protein